MSKTIEELDQHISKNIQGVFSTADMKVLKEEIEKLKPGDIYVEIGVDEGRSARVAHEYAHPDVYKLFIDIHDPQASEGISIGRARWMEQEGMVGIGKKGFYIHGDGDEFGKLIGEILQNTTAEKFIDLMFIDGFHDTESLLKNINAWEKLMKSGNVILYHDFDHPNTRDVLNERYGNNKEIFHNKIVKVIIK